MIAPGGLCRLAIHANPGVLGVHLVHNLVQFCSCLANNERTEQLIHLQGLCNRELASGLEFILDLRELFPLLILLSLHLAFRGLEEQFLLLPHFNNNLKGIPNVLKGPLLFKETLDGNDVEEVFLIVPLAESRHLEIGPIQYVDLDLLGVPLFM
jgi:hypothetical protein